MSARKRVLAAAAAVAMWAVIQPGTVSAQTSGIGPDGYTRFLWKGTDYSISLWQLDPSLNFFNNHVYGPYNGWDPIAITTAHDNNSYVLWRYQDGTITLWTVDTFLNYVTQKNYGPYTGWTAERLTENELSDFSQLWHDGCVEAISEAQNVDRNHSTKV